MAEIPNPVDALTQQDFLDLAARILPSHYLAPLIDPGPGYEAIQSAALAFAGASYAAMLAGQDAQISTASSGAKATGTVELYRSGPHPESITVVVEAGTEVTTSNGGRSFLLTSSVTFGPSDTGPFEVPIIAVDVGYEFNVRGQTTTADGTVIPGDIDTITKLVEAPELGDITIGVRQVDPTAGGKDAALDALGYDRNIARSPGEPDSLYRARIRALPDNISPDAFDRACKTALRAYGATYNLVETSSILYQTCWDGPSNSIAGSLYDPNLFAYDDPRVPESISNVWMDENDFRGAGIVVVDNIQPISDVGMVYYDSPLPAETPVAGQYGVLATLAAGPTFGQVTVGGLTGMAAGSVGRYLNLSESANPTNIGAFLIIGYISATSVVVWNPASVLPDANSGSIHWVEMYRPVDDETASDLVSPETGGDRAACAYDVPSTLNFGYLQGGYDGFDLGKNSVYKGLYDLLQSIKAGGVSVTVELRGA